MSSLEAIKAEETADLYSYQIPGRTQEIYDFELQQLQYANNTIREREEEKREKEIKQKRLEEERERIRREEERRKLLTPEEKLYEEREQYYKDEVPKIIEEYKKEAKRYKNIHDRLQWTIIICSAFVTSLTGITVFTSIPILSYTFKSIAAICSLAVTIASSIMGYFKYRERSTNLQKAVDDIEYEHEAIKLGTYLYLNKPREQAIGIFADRVTNRIKEQKEQQQILEEPPDIKQPQAKPTT